MKTPLLIITCCLFSLLSFGQYNEFDKNDNGLIYSDKAIGELKHIVDSLNLKFKVCDNKDFYSKRQGRATYITLEGKKAGLARKDIDKGISYDDFLKKYPDAEIEGDFLFAVYNYEDYNGNKVVEFDFISFDEFNSPYYHVPENKFKVQNWYYNYHEKNDYSEEQLLVFYVPKGITNKPMQEKYSRMVQYSECLVDTTAQIFFKTPDPLEDIYLDDSDSGHKILDFTSYMNEKTNKPKSSDYNLEDVDGYKLYDLDLEKWRGDWITKTKIFNEDKKAQLMFKEALDVATLTMLGTSDEFENYVLHFDSPEKALFLKRSRRVVGRCSMDSSPRYHALTIAELAGETATWEIFLRAHLDIMNDRFDRVSDGSYAQAQRQTYIKELEELDINLPDLLLGICLRVENSSQNHYYGDIGRIGRALSESKDKLVFEQTMLDMIKDEKLDDYNRIIMYYLFANYNHYIKEENLKELNDNRLREAVATLPNYLKSSIKI